MWRVLMNTVAENFKTDTELTFCIEGMTCASCVARVEKAL